MSAPRPGCPKVGVPDGGSAYVVWTQIGAVLVEASDAVAVEAFLRLRHQTLGRQAGEAREERVADAPGEALMNEDLEDAFNDMLHGGTG